MKAFFKFVTRAFLLLLVCICGSVIYLDVYGFPPFLKSLVEAQFYRQGVSAHFSSIHLDVLRGIIAKEAVLARASTPDQTLARIDEVQIVWNWPRLMHGQNAIDELRIANASVTVPTPADEIGPQVFVAEQAYATFRLEDDGSVQIDQLTGVYAGIRLQVSGQINQLRSEAIGALPSGRSESGRSPFIFITKALRELNDLHGTEPPQLDVNFDLDLASPIASRVTAKLSAADVVYRKINVENLSVVVEMKDGVINIHEAILKVGKGQLSIAGHYDIAAGGFDLKLTSNLDPNLFLPALPAAVNNGLRDLHVWEPPEIEIHYVLSPETGVLPVLQGRVVFGALEFHSVPFRSIAFAFENKGPDLKVTDVKIAMREGQVTGRGQYQIETSDFRYEIDSTIDPRKLIPIMEAMKMRGQLQLIEPSWFETAPHIVAAVRGDFVDPEAFAYDASVDVGRCSYRGVALNSVAADLKLRHNRLSVTNLNVQRDEGEVVGTVQADFDQHTIGFNLNVTANPSQMMPLLGPKPAAIMRPYRFGPHTIGNAHGLIDLDHLSNTCWEGHVSNEGFSYWKLTAEQATADLAMTNGILKIDNFDADIYNGKLRGKAAFNFEANPGYQFDFSTEKVDVRKLLSAISKRESGASGLMTGQAVISGQGSDLGTIKGKGSVSVENGVLWEIPIFGIFSHILNDIGRGLGSTKATKATATFTIEDKAVRTEDMTVAAGAFTLNGRGKLGFDGKLDFRIQGQLLQSWPGVSLLTWFLKHIFEYKIGGTLGNYTYRPTNLPKEFLPHSEGSGGGNEKTPPESSEEQQ